MAAMAGCSAAVAWGGPCREGLLQVSTASSPPTGAAASNRSSLCVRTARYGFVLAATPKYVPRNVCYRISASQGSEAGQSAVSVVSPGNPSSLSSLFQGVEVLSTTGERLPVLDLWRERRVVVAWARHFGCLLCKKRAVQLLQKKDDLERAGVALIIIGPGSPEQAESFKYQTSFPGEVYADPTFATFKQLGFVSGSGSVFTPKALVNLIGASLEGFRQDWGLSLQRDTVFKGAWQQGGVMVAGPGTDRLHFLFKDAEAGDEPDWEEVTAAALQD